MYKTEKCIREHGPLQFQTITPSNNFYNDLQGCRVSAQTIIDLAKDLPVFDVQIASLYIGGATMGDYNTIKSLVEHMKRIQNVDLSYPIILGSDGHIMDGNHRIAKAILEGLTHIPAKRFVVQPDISEHHKEA